MKSQVSFDDQQSAVANNNRQENTASPTEQMDPEVAKLKQPAS